MKAKGFVEIAEAAIRLGTAAKELLTTKKGEAVEAGDASQVEALVELAQRCATAEARVKVLEAERRALQSDLVSRYTTEYPSTKTHKPMLDAFFAYVLRGGRPEL